jgi:XTP/dITP diphosphohydrolase
MKRLLEVMRRLRAPGGCPWDQEQTHETLRPYLLEEAAEAVEAIETGRPEAVVEELGDVLLQVAFHAVIAEEKGSFTYTEVERGIVDKLVRRHPHVFGAVEVADADEVVRNWQRIKAEEEAGSDSAPSVPRGLPALLRAFEYGKRLHWNPVDEELDGCLRDLVSKPEMIGRFLLVAAQIARRQNLNPEMALRDAVNDRLAEGER